MDALEYPPNVLYIRVTTSGRTRGGGGLSSLWKRLSPLQAPPHFVMKTFLFNFNNVFLIIMWRAAWERADGSPRYKSLQLWWSKLCTTLREASCKHTTHTLETHILSPTTTTASVPPTLPGSDAALGDHGRDHHNNMIIIYMHIYIIIWRHRTDLYVTKRNYENLFFICVSDDERCLLCDLIGWFVSYCSAGVGNWRPAGHNWPARHNIWPARLFWSYMILFFIFLYRISISVSLNVKGYTMNFIFFYNRFFI